MIERDADLMDTGVVNSLPESLRETLLDGGNGDSDETATHLSPSKSQQYNELQLRLTQLAAQRDDKLQKLQRYQKLQQLLRPYEQPESNVQPNLVQKDGEMAEELARLRVLCARVAGRVDGWDAGQRTGGEKSKGEGGSARGGGFEEKLRKILEAA